jgi:hypothetical protein
MLNLTKISAVLLNLSLSLSLTTTAAAHFAEEVSLENLISKVLAQSVASVQQELSNNIQGGVLTTAKQMSISEDTYATNTNSTDLNSQIEQTVHHAAK